MRAFWEKVRRYAVWDRPAGSADPQTTKPLTDHTSCDGRGPRSLTFKTPSWRTYAGAAKSSKTPLPAIPDVQRQTRYRPLVHLAHPELTAESLRRTSGNFGIIDQIAALRCVRTKIAAFGGDQARVTVAGQFAGATLVSLLQPRC